MPASAVIALCCVAPGVAGCILLGRLTPSSVPPPSADAPVIAEAPATRIAKPVAVYYSPQTRAAIARDGSPDFSNLVAADVGPATVELFDRVLREMFASVEEAPSPAPAPGAPAVLEVQVAGAKVSRGWNMTASVPCVFVLRDSRGEVGRWSLTGTGRYGRSLSESMPYRAGQAASLALSDAARQFAQGFARQPGFADWLAGGAPLATDPAAAPGPSPAR